MNHQIPNIYRDLQQSREVLEGLEETLPTVQKQVNEIQRMYDSGRQKVCNDIFFCSPSPHQYQAKYLVEDLKWLNTEFYERWRLITFTNSSPVSTHWKIVMRTLFVLLSILFCWFSWIAVKGAYRAHSHRLVWGDKLMS